MLEDRYAHFTRAASPPTSGDSLPSSPDGDRKYPDYCKTLQIKDSNGMVKELVFPKALDLDRPKRARTTFSAEQLYYLERDFQRNQYLVGRERTDLATRLQLSETQVKVWFQNRRTKHKRDKVKEVETQKQKAETVAACNIMRMLHQPPTPTYLSPLGNASPLGYTGFSPRDLPAGFSPRDLPPISTGFSPRDLPPISSANPCIPNYRVGFGS